MQDILSKEGDWPDQPQRAQSIFTTLVPTLLLTSSTQQSLPLGLAVNAHGHMHAYALRCVSHVRVLHALRALTPLWEGRCELAAW